MTSVPTDPGASIHGVRSPIPESVSTARSSSRNATLTLAGVMYILVTLFLAVGAINAQNNLLFWLFGFAIAILITSGLLSGNAMMRLHVRGLPIAVARAGEVRTVRYQLKSRSRMFPLFGLILREEIQRETLVDITGPGVVVHLSPKASGTATARMIAHKRGRYALPAFRVESSFPFGIIRKWIRYEQLRSLIVVPHLLPLKPIGFLHQPGEHAEEQFAKPKRGPGSEFFGLRPYVPGDPRRKIAWKTSARREGLFVLEHAKETEPKVIVWLQRPADSTPIELRERAIALACSLVHAASDANCAVGFWAPWASIRYNAAPGISQIKKIEYALAHLQISSSDTADPPPPTRSGRLIRVSSSSTETANPLAGEFAADQPQLWLRADEQLPRSLQTSSEESK